MDEADVVTPSDHPCQLTHRAGPPDPLHIRKNTQKSKFLLSQAFKWKKFTFFVIPEMPSKTFVMVLKKLPDHFNNKNERVPITNIEAKYKKMPFELKKKVTPQN